MMDTERKDTCNAGILGPIACGIPADVEEYVEEYNNVNNAAKYELRRRGGILMPYLSRSVDYLVIGLCRKGSEQVSFESSYIHEALERREKGRNIQLISDVQFWQALQSCPTKFTDEEVMEKFSDRSDEEPTEEDCSEAYAEFASRMEDDRHANRTVEEVLQRSRKAFVANQRAKYGDIDNWDYQFTWGFGQIDPNARVKFEGKCFTLNSGFDEEYVILEREIKKRGGTIRATMCKSTDYFVLNTNYPQFSGISEAMKWREKGETNCLISDFQLWLALNNPDIPILYTDEELEAQERAEEAKKTAKAKKKGSK